MGSWDKTWDEKDGRLDPAFKKRWLEALRSGKYEQGNAALREDNRFCCLGVAADIACNLEWQRHWDSCYSICCDTAFISGSDIPHHVQADLADRNDSGISFLEIADYIEENL